MIDFVEIRVHECVSNTWLLQCMWVGTISRYLAEADTENDHNQSWSVSGSWAALCVSSWAGCMWIKRWLNREFVFSVFLSVWVVHCSNCCMCDAVCSQYLVAIPAVIEAGAEAKFCATLRQPSGTLVMTVTLMSREKNTTLFTHTSNEAFQTCVQFEVGNQHFHTQSVFVSCYCKHYWL